MHLPVLALITVSGFAQETNSQRGFERMNALISELRQSEVTTIKASGNDSIVGFVSIEVSSQFEKSVAQKDKEGVLELISAGSIVLLDPNTEVRVLETSSPTKDRLISNVRDLYNIYVDTYKACLQRNLRRVNAGLNTVNCESEKPDWEAAFAKMAGAEWSAKEFVAKKVFVQVRVLAGARKNAELWLAFGDLVTPSKPAE